MKKVALALLSVVLGVFFAVQVRGAMTVIDQQRLAGGADVACWAEGYDTDGPEEYVSCIGCSYQNGLAQGLHEDCVLSSSPSRR